MADNLMNHLRVISEPNTSWRPPTGIEGRATAQKVYLAFRDYYRSRPQEEMIVLALNAEANVIGYSVVGRGAVNRVDVWLMHVFQFLILANAPLFIVVHNHPNVIGDPNPSDEDMAFMQCCLVAGRQLGIGLYDSVIIGGDSYFSCDRTGL